MSRETPAEGGPLRPQISQIPYNWNVDSWHRRGDGRQKVALGVNTITIEVRRVLPHGTHRLLSQFLRKRPS